MNYDIYDFILKYVNLGKKSDSDWYLNLSRCPYCHDGKSKKERSSITQTF